MESKGFSVGGILSKGWHLMKKTFWFWLLFILAFYGSQVAFGLAPLMLFGEGGVVVESAVLFWVSYVLLLLLYTILLLGLMRLGLRVATKERGSFKDLFGAAPKCITYIIGTILYALIVIAGTILLVIPGMYWGVQYSMFPYFILDKDAGPIDALKMSGKATYGFKWDIFCYMVAAAIVSVLGLLAFGVGVFAAVPIIFIGWGLIYRRITHA